MCGLVQTTFGFGVGIVVAKGRDVTVVDVYNRWWRGDQRKGKKREGERTLLPVGIASDGIKR